MNINPFNLYYLNLQKGYEISMMINNVVLTSLKQTTKITNSNSSKTKINLNFGLGNKKFLKDIKSGLTMSKETSNNKSFAAEQGFEVKTTKSLLLANVINNSKIIDNFNDVQEGDLVKTDNIKLDLIDN
jgi:hypothetical protein